MWGNVSAEQQLIIFFMEKSVLLSENTGKRLWLPAFACQAPHSCTRFLFQGGGSWFQTNSPLHPNYILRIFLCALWFIISTLGRWREPEAEASRVSQSTPITPLDDSSVGTDSGGWKAFRELRRQAAYPKATTLQ